MRGGRRPTRRSGPQPNCRAAPPHPGGPQPTSELSPASDSGPSAAILFERSLHDSALAEVKATFIQEVFRVVREILERRQPANWPGRSTSTGPSPVCLARCSPGVWPPIARSAGTRSLTSWIRSSPPAPVGRSAGRLVGADDERVTKASPSRRLDEFSRRLFVALHFGDGIEYRAPDDVHLCRFQLDVEIYIYNCYVLVDIDRCPGACRPCPCCEVRCGTRPHTSGAPTHVR